MASRPIFSPFPVIVNGNMSTNITSAVTIIQNLSMLSYDISWTGTPVGTFSVQVSNTYTQNGAGVVQNAGNWTTLTLSSPTTATGSSGNGFIDIDEIGAFAIRLVYTAGSGSGTLNATIAGKVA